MWFVPLRRQQLVAPPGAAGRSSLRSPRLSRHPHDRARRAVVARDGLFRIVFHLIWMCQGFSLHGGSWHVAVVVWGCRTFDSLLPIFPPFLLLRGPLSRAFVPWAAQTPTGTLVYFLSSLCRCAAVSCYLSVSTKSVFRYTYGRAPASITKIQQPNGAPWEKWDFSEIM